MSDKRLVIDDEYEERTLGNKDVVVMANSLIRSGHETLGVYEAKLVRLAIANIDKNDTELYTYTCTASNLAKYLGADQKHIYSIIDDITNSLFGRVIRISDGTKDKKGNPNYSKINWVQKCEYKDGKLSITLSNQLKPFVIGLKSMFTMYLTDNVMKLSTTNSIRLYELIMSWNNANRSPGTIVDNPTGLELDDDELAFDIDYLRHYFDCDVPNEKSGKIKYPNNGNFVKKVIEKSVQEINDKLAVTGPVMEFRAVKREGEGNKISAVVFKLLKRPPMSDLRSEEEINAAKRARAEGKED